MGLWMQTTQLRQLCTLCAHHPSWSPLPFTPSIVGNKCSTSFINSFKYYMSGISWRHGCQCQSQNCTLFLCHGGVTWSPVCTRTKDLILFFNWVSILSFKTLEEYSKRENREKYSKRLLEMSKIHCKIVYWKVTS